MIFSQKHKYIFVHIPKTAGTSVSRLLRPSATQGNQFDINYLKLLCKHEGVSYVRPTNSVFIKTGPNHISAGELKAVLGQNYDNYFKFSFVRNPWDWKLSNYKYVLKCHGHRAHKLYASYKNFRNYIIATPHRPRQQSDYIYSTDDKPLVDYVGRFEQLQKDFDTVCDEIGIPQQQLPHKNATKHKHYTEFYDEETREIVAEQYARDIELFGYEFGK